MHLIFLPASALFCVRIAIPELISTGDKAPARFPKAFLIVHILGLASMERTKTGLQPV